MDSQDARGNLRLVVSMWVVLLVYVRAYRSDGITVALFVGRHKGGKVTGHSLDEQEFGKLRQPGGVRRLHIDSGRAVNVNVDQSGSEVCAAEVNGLARAQTGRRLLKGEH